MNSFTNLTSLRLIINLYGLQVSRSLKTYKAIKLGIECTNFFSKISCLQLSVLIIHGYYFQVSDARERPTLCIRKLIYNLTSYSSYTVTFKSNKATD